MKDTGFTVAGQNIRRLATLYQGDEVNGEVVVEDGPDGYWSRPPAFEDGGGGLVSTMSDYLAFASALLAGGTYQGERILSRPSVTLMTADQLMPAQNGGNPHAPGRSRTAYVADLPRLLHGRLPGDRRLTAGASDHEVRRPLPGRCIAACLRTRRR